MRERPPDFATISFPMLVAAVLLSDGLDLASMMLHNWFLFALSAYVLFHAVKAFPEAIAPQAPQPPAPQPEPQSSPRPS